MPLVAYRCVIKLGPHFGVQRHEYVTGSRPNGKELKWQRKTLRFVLVVLGPLLAVPAMLRADAPKSNDKPTTQQGSDNESAVTKISLAEFDTMRGEKDTVVLDVRTPREFTAGHVPGAINLDWHLRNFNDKVEKLDKTKKYLVHCMAGGRSAAATRRMSTLGFKNLYDFSGGWSEYSKSKPVEK